MLDVEFETRDGTGVTPDGSCVQIAARSAPSTAAHLFREMNLRLTHNPEARRRRSGDQPTLLLPIEPYHVAVVTTAALDPTYPLLDTDGSTALEDAEPPTFLDCPGDLVVTTEPGKATATAIWTVPTAVDNVDPNPTVVGTHTPGSAFSVADSPITVSYTASDGRQATKCTFHITVAFDRRTAHVSAAVNSSFPATLRELPERHVRRVRQALVRGDIQPLRVLPALDPPSFTELRFSLTTPPNEPLLLRTRSEAVEAQVVVDLTWFREGVTGIKPTSIPPQSDVGVRIELNGYTVESASSPEVANLTAAEQTQVLQPVNRFRAASATIDTTAGVIRVTGAYSLPFRRGVVFSTLSLVLLVPAGRNTDNFPTAKWTLTAKSGMYVEYDYPERVSGDVIALGSAVTLQDQIPPEFINCPAGSVLEAPTLLRQAVAKPMWTPPVAVDNNGYLHIISDYEPGVSEFLLGKPTDPPITIRYTAIDTFANTAVCEFGLRVVDREPPLIELPPPLTVLLPDTSRALRATVPLDDMLPVSMSDNSGMGLVTQQPTAAVQLAAGTHNVAVRVRDVWGNTALKLLAVTVLDITPPSIFCPPDLTVPSAGTLTPVEWAIPVVDDNDYDGGVTRPLMLNMSATSGDLFGSGDTVVTATVVDLSGNVNSCNFTVSVVSSRGGTQSSTGANVGTGTGVGVAFIVLLVGLLLIRRARRKARAPQDWDEIFLQMEQFKNAQGSNGPVVPREILRGSITMLEEIGKGAFGIVYKALLKEDKRAGYLVAAKSLHDHATATEKQELLEEAAVMAQFDNPFVTNLVGVVTVGAPVLMLVEYAEHGSLKLYLEKTEVPETQRLLWAGDVAEGLAHVHAKGFLHRDVSARNVLIGSAMRCKVSDFGLAREVDEHDTYYRSRSGQLPVRWTAPEALDSRKFNDKTDVWSFGVLLYEMWTRASMPYGDWNNQRVWVEVSHGYRLPQPEDCANEAYDLMRQCWMDAQADRPTFAVLAAQLRQLQPSGDEPEVPDYGVALDLESSTSSTQLPDVYDVGANNTLQRPEKKGGLLTRLFGVGSAQTEPTDGGDDGTGSANSNKTKVVGIQMSNPLFVPRNVRTPMAVNAIYDLGASADPVDQESSECDSEPSVNPPLQPPPPPPQVPMNSEPDEVGMDDLSMPSVVPPPLPLDDTEDEVGKSSSDNAPSGLRPPLSATLRPRKVAVAPSMVLDIIRAVDEEAGSELPGAVEDGGEDDASAAISGPLGGESLYDNDTAPNVVMNGDGGGEDDAYEGALGQLPTEADIGKKVRVEGYASCGILRFVGLHHVLATPRCGVEMEAPEGKNNGTVRVGLKLGGR